MKLVALDGSNKTEITLSEWEVDEVRQAMNSKSIVQVVTPGSTA